MFIWLISIAVMWIIADSIAKALRLIGKMIQQLAINKESAGYAILYFIIWIIIIAGFVWATIAVHAQILGYL